MALEPVPAPDGPALPPRAPKPFRAGKALLSLGFVLILQIVAGVFAVLVSFILNGISTSR